MNSRSQLLPRPLLLFTLSLLVAAHSAWPACAQEPGPDPDRSSVPVTPRDLPDAPDASFTPVSESSSAALLPDFAPAFEPSGSLAIEPGQHPPVPLAQCPYDQTRARECRIHWGQLMIEASLYTAAQNAFNLYSGYWYRWETTHGVWMQRWF